MPVVGTVESLWRYPVKSMAGEELQEAYLGFGGVYGDRLYAFTSDAADPAFPWLTAREQRRMLLYRPRFRHAELAALPPNLAQAEASAPGLTPLYADVEGLSLEVETPEGERLGLDDPVLAGRLNENIGRKHNLSLQRSERAMTDCRPLSLCSLATVAQLEAETGRPVDKRQFRANAYLNLDSGDGFGEDAFIGKRLQIGEKVIVSILERDPRCALITLHPDTAERDPAILTHVSKAHDGHAGVYAAVLVEGVMKTGDSITLLD